MKAKIVKHGEEMQEPSQVFEAEGFEVRYDRMDVDHLPMLILYERRAGTEYYIEKALGAWPAKYTTIHLEK